MTRASSPRKPGLLRRTYRAVLWRVRNRLLFTSFLFGVVPLALIALLLSQAVQILLGQYASSVVRDALDSQIASTATAARLLTPPARISLTHLDEIRQQTPLLRVVVEQAGQTSHLPEMSELRTIPEWMEADFKGIIESEGSFYIAASAIDSTTRLLAYLQLDGPALGRLTRGDVAVTVVPVSDREADTDIDIRIDPSSGQSFIRRDGVETVLEASTASVAAVGGFPDKALSWLMPLTVTSTSGREVTTFLVLTSTRSLVFSRLFSSLGPMARGFAIVMSVVALIFLVVEIVSLTWSIKLTRTITRSIHELYEATRQVAAGDLSHRAPLRGFDQLTELSGSFNRMTGRIQELIAHVKEKEKIEAELGIARRVQLELFPQVTPNLSSLELVGSCMPSRFVSGDYFDFVPLDSRWTAVVLGDVSGKGIGAALVMATLQAALHAQLKFAGGATQESAEGALPSTARLTARLSQQLYENTPGEKYATLFCSLYDDRTGRLVYTNAGHLPPLLVRDGRATAFETGGTVVGLMPMFSYDQQVVELCVGDLLAIFSDGVTEAENAAGEQFEAARLTELLVENSRLPLDELLKVVTDHLTRWIHDPESRDDITLVLARRRPTATVDS